MSEISVEMRLKLNQIRSDAGKAGQEIRSGLASSVKGLSPTSMEQDERRARIQRGRRNAALDAEDRRRELAENLKMNQQKLSQEIEAATRRNKARQLWRDREQSQLKSKMGLGESARADQARFEKNMMASMLPMLRPTSPWGAFFASRQAFQAFSGTKAGAGAQGKMGLPSGNMGAIAAAGIVTAAALAVGFTLKILAKTISESIAQIENARHTYAKILQSGGMAAGFIVKREQLANILGVSEEQVMQYGAAINYLNSKLDWSSKILTLTNPTLTAVSWQFKILQEDMKAMWATIANEAVPAIMLFTKAIDGLVKVMTVLLIGIANSSQILQLLKLIPSLNPKAPVTPTSLNRMPSSTWEKMGLVVGNSGGTNHLMKIAANTKKSADALTQIVQGMGGKIQTGQNPIAAYPAP